MAVKILLFKFYKFLFEISIIVVLETFHDPALDEHSTSISQLDPRACISIIDSLSCRACAQDMAKKILSLPEGFSLPQDKRGTDFYGAYWKQLKRRNRRVITSSAAQALLRHAASLPKALLVYLVSTNSQGKVTGGSVCRHTERAAFCLLARERKTETVREMRI